MPVNQTAPQAGVLSGANPSAFNSSDPFVLFVIQATIIIVTCRLLAIPLAKIRQPRVIAEVIGGIILGPSVMGRIPNYMNTIFPTASLPYLNLISTIGLVFFLFQVGLEVDVKLIKRSARKSLTVGIMGMALPFAMGIAVSYGLYRLQNDDTIPFGSYLLFLGVAMSITAFPVLARILAELRLLKTNVGAITMSAGVLNDCTAWVLLALVVALLNSSGGLTALWVFLCAVAFSLFLIFGVGPLYHRLCLHTGSYDNGPTPLVMTVTLVIVLISAFVTDIIGIHPIFGGFLAGVIIPHERGLAVKIAEKIEDIVNIVFLPLYFALSGLKTQIGLLDTGEVWGYVFLVIFVACFGKITGCTAAARINGMNWRESFTVGFLMNCKGLVELIVLNIGKDSGVLNDQTFVIMVVMAIVTTCMTTPAVLWLYPESYQRQRARELGEAGSKSPLEVISPEEPKEETYRVMVTLNKLESVPAMMVLIQMLQHDASSERRRRRSFQHPQRWPLVQLEVHALRLIELTQRSSAVMKIQDIDTLERDPVLSVFRTFARLGGIKLKDDVTITTPTEFSNVVIAAAQDDNVNAIILPWQLLAKDAAKTHDNHHEGSSEFNKEALDDVRYAAFLRRVLETSQQTVGVLVDRGYTKTAYSKTILVPFIGGSDDREAIKFALRMQTDGAKILIVRFIKEEEQSEKKRPISHLTSSRNPSVFSIQTYLQEIDAVASDQTFFETLSEDGIISNGNQVAHDTIPENDEYYHDIPQYQTVHISKVKQQISTFVEDLHESDLVIVGRRRLDSDKATLDGGVNEAGKTLGGVAQIIMSVRASLLVVQAAPPSSSNITEYV
ncbi:Sodium/hydrogen exchanger family-domain-containing protein [Umbelopsis sp. PMI_123]|nr:Sodium/hydrogen exchanger family-domain-containing protein [Umbelopsis sp. PMI_123]